MPRVLPLAFALHLAAASLGCAGETPTKASDSATAPSAATSAGSLDPSHSVGPSESAEAPALDRSPLEPRAAKGKLHVAAYQKGPEGFAFGAQASRHFKVFPFPDRMIVTLAGQVYELDGAKLTLSPKAPTTEKVEGATPVLGAYQIERLEGQWPDELWVTAEFNSFMGPRQSSNRTVDYRRTAGKWTTEKSLPVNVRPWTPGVFLGFVGDELRVVAGDAKAPRRAPAPNTSGRCAKGHLVIPHDLVALPSGHVFLLGAHCATHAFVVESWRPGSEESTVTEVVADTSALGVTLTGHHLAAATDRAVFVALSTHGAPFALFRGDARGFRRVQTRDEGRVVGLHATPDGAVFAALDGGRRAPSALVSLTANDTSTSYRYGLDRSVRLGGLWASDAETAYVAVDDRYGDDAILLSTREVSLLGSPPADLWKDAPPAPAALGEVFPAFDDRCTTPFVYLYDVAATTPKNFDFPKTRKALTSFSGGEGLTLLDFEHAGKRRLGVPVGSPSVGADLVRHVRAEMPEDDPRLVCFAAPEGARKVVLDR